MTTPWTPTLGVMSVALRKSLGTVDTADGDRMDKHGKGGRHTSAFADVTKQERSIIGLSLLPR